MNAVTSERSFFSFERLSAASEAAPETRTKLGLWPLLAVATTFWVYVTLSNVLYAHSMQIGFSSMTPGKFFAPWNERVLQHLFLYPVFVACVLASLRIGWRPGWRAIPVQILLAAGFAALATPALMGAGAILAMEPTDHGMAHDWPHSLADFLQGTAALWIGSATTFLLTYGFGLALITGITLYQRFRDSQLRSAALERALTSAHLAALRMQLSPHTLFNLLHTIRGQIGWDPQAAQSMVVQLGELLRRLLTAGERDFSRLADEMKFVRLYLELQQKRFSDRLTLWIADLDGLAGLWVPSLILQPLVENAVVHGLAGHGGPVEIRVEVCLCGETLHLRVINTAAQTNASSAEGIGIRNVRERLAVQFGERATFESARADAGHWIAAIRMPALHDGPDRTGHS